MPVDYLGDFAISSLPRLRWLAKGGSFATERAMFLTFERLSTPDEAGRHQEFRSLQTMAAACETRAKRDPLFECCCGVQIWDWVPTEATN